MSFETAGEDISKALAFYKTHTTVSENGNKVSVFVLASSEQSSDIMQAIERWLGRRPARHISIRRKLTEGKMAKIKLDNEKDVYIQRIESPKRALNHTRSSATLLEE